MNCRITICSIAFFALSSLFASESRDASSLDASPGAVVKAFMTAANDGRYSECEKYMVSGDLAEFARQAGGSEAVLKGLLDGRTKHRTITTFEITEEKVREDGALVFARIKYRDGSSECCDMTPLIKHEGAWRIVFSDAHVRNNPGLAALGREYRQTIDKNTAQAVFDQFTKKVATNFWIQPQDLIANPFRLESKVVAVPLTLVQMISPTEAMSAEGVLISDVDKNFVTMRLEHRTLVGGVVKGTKAVRTPVGGEINAPVISYIYSIPNWDENLTKRGVRN